MIYCILRFSQCFLNTIVVFIDWLVIWHGNLAGCWFRISNFYRFTVSYKNIIDLITIQVLSKWHCLEIVYIFVWSRWCSCLMYWLMFEESVHPKIMWFAQFCKFLTVFIYIAFCVFSNDLVESCISITHFYFCIKNTPDYD